MVIKVALTKRKSVQTILFLTIMIFGSVLPINAQDWPMYRADLENTGSSSSSAPSNGILYWNYTTGNAVMSSPAVADGKVYVGSYDNNVYCLDATTGEWIWNYTTGSRARARSQINNVCARGEDDPCGSWAGHIESP